MSEFCVGTDHEPWHSWLIMSHHQVFSKASKSDYHFGKLMVYDYHFIIKHGIHTIIFLVKQHGMDTTTWSVDKSSLRGSNRRARQAWGRPSSVDGGSGWTIRTSFAAKHIFILISILVVFFVALFGGCWDLFEDWHSCSKSSSHRKLLSKKSCCLLTHQFGMLTRLKLRGYQQTLEIFSRWRKFGWTPTEMDTDVDAAMGWGLGSMTFHQKMGKSGWMTRGSTLWRRDWTPRIYWSSAETADPMKWVTSHKTS